MTVPFRIREAGSDDNDRLIELARRCSTKGRLNVYSDRYPDFFAMTRQQGERSFVYVGESLQGDIVGCAVLIERTEFDASRNQTIKVLHIGDLKIDPSVRRTHLAPKLIAVYREKLLSGGYHHGAIEIIKSNAEPSRANRLLSSDVIVKRQARVTMYKLLPIWNYKTSTEWNYRQATPQDFPQLSKLLQSVYRNSLGAPSFSLEWLQAATQKHSSFNFANIWVATGEKGVIKACLAQWDQKALRKTVISRTSKIVRILVRFLALIGLLWRLPPLPKKGRALDFRYLRWLAAEPEDMAALRSLLRFVMCKSREDEKCQFMMVGFHDRDRLKSALRGIIKLKEPMHIYSHRLKDLETPNMQGTSAPQKQGHYVDLALI